MHLGALGPFKPHSRGKKTLVLDLDETLVHSSFKAQSKPDIILPIEIEGNVCNVFVVVRPGTEFFLQRLAKCYELVIYTASLSKYAEPLIDILDNK
jgi:RNA polymerase II subunit A small phosphatase-like protein